MMSNRGWLQPSSCPWLDRFSTVSGDGPDFGQILISPLIWVEAFGAELLSLFFLNE
jgi:hypothetical protein